MVQHKVAQTNLMIMNNISWKFVKSACRKWNFNKNIQFAKLTWLKLAFLFNKCNNVLKKSPHQLWSSANFCKQPHIFKATHLTNKFFNLSEILSRLFYVLFFCKNDHNCFWRHTFKGLALDTIKCDKFKFHKKFVLFTNFEATQNLNYNWLSWAWTAW